MSDNFYILCYTFIRFQFDTEMNETTLSYAKVHSLFYEKKGIENGSDDMIQCWNAIKILVLIQEEMEMKWNIFVRDSQTVVKKGFIRI